jgi:hypothetical protein
LASSATQPRRARSALGVAALLAGFGGLLSTPITARAATPAVAITGVRTPWNGTLHLGSWVPIEIGLRAGDAEFDGHVAVSVAPAAGGNASVCFQSGSGTFCRGSGPFVGKGSSSDVEYDVPVVLAPGVAKTVAMTVLPGSSGLTVQVVSSSGTVVASTSTDLDVSASSNRAVVAVVSSDPSACDGLGLGLGQLPGEDRASVIHLQPGDLPGSGAVMGSFDMVILDQAPTDTLTPEQRQALADYVARGGSLLVAGGAEARATLAGLPAGLAPVSLQGTASLADLSQLRAAEGLPALSGPLAASTVQAHGAVAVREHGLPLLTTAAYGAGQVSFLAVDPAAEPLRSWSGTPALLRQLLLRNTHMVSSGPYTRYVQMGSGQVQATLANESGLLAGALLTAPGVSLPDPAMLGGLLAGYIVLVGPFTYLLLRRARRRDLLWVAVPVVAALATGLSYTTGLGASGRGPTLSEVRVLQLTPGSDRAEVASFATVFSPHGGTHTLQLLGDPAVSSLPGADGSILTVRPGESPEQVDLHADIATLRGWSATRAAVVQGAVRASLHFDGSTLSGTVTNGLATDLTDVAVAVPGRPPVRIGNLARGATQQISVSLPTSSNGPYSGGGACWGCGAPLGASAADREQYQRGQVSSGLDDIAGVVGGVAPVLVGLASSPLLPTDVQGDGSGTRPIDAIVVPLPLSVDSSHAMNSAPATLVDLSETPAASDSAVYEASLPGGPAAWTHVQVSVDANCGSCGKGFGFSGGGVKIAPPVPVAPVPIPPGPVPVAPGPVPIAPMPVPAPGFSGGATGVSPSASVQVYDMQAQRWVDVATSLSGNTLIFTVPDVRRDVDADGNLWVRVQGTNAAYSGGVRVSADRTGAAA